MKYVVLLASIVLSIFYTTSLIVAPKLGLPGQLNYSPVTVDEIQALEWIRDNYESPQHNKSLWDFVICDYFCKEYAAVVFFELELHRKYNWNTAVVSDALFWVEHLLIYEMTVLGEDVSDEGYMFALYSSRQAEKAIFRLWAEDGTRRQYEAFPMMNLWENNGEWRKAYQHNAVVVYERVTP